MYAIRSYYATRGIDDVIAIAKRAETLGFGAVWMANIFSFDAITALTLIGRETDKVALGTAVVPTYPRHPTAIAQQALTAASATGNRFYLGIGLSHQVVIDRITSYNVCYTKLLRAMLRKNHAPNRVDAKCSIMLS